MQAMDLPLGMVRQKVHVQMITRYARMTALVQVRVITIINSKFVYGINLIMPSGFHE